MSSSTASSLIQRVVSARGPKDYAGRSTPAEARGREVYFELELSNPDVDFDPFAQALANVTAKQPNLLPGNKYRVRASASLYRQTDRSPVFATAPIILFLCCPEVPGISIQDARRTVEAEAISTCDEEFELTIPAECPTGHYELKLFWAYQGENKKARTAASLTFCLEGTYYPVDMNLLTTCRIVADLKLPEHTAILHIEVPEKDKYRLTGWSYREEPLRTGLIEQPSLALADFIEEKLDPAHVRGNLSSFSRRNSIDLLDWLDRLYQRHGDKLCMIIADHSVSEFPWEMMEIDQGKYLGAIWKVVRWIPIRAFRTWHNLCVQEEVISGEVLAYLDQEELNIELESHALDQFTTSYYDDPTLLRKRLSEPLNAVALIYLGCHGIFTYDNKHEIAVGELQNPSKRLISLSIEGIKRHEGGRPILFVNACHSARLIRDSSGFYGMPEVFLSLVASAYLGTLGPVGSSHAARIAKLILSRAAESSIEPAEVLRELRAQAVAELARSESHENWLSFIYTFMYVYYGNPFTKILLSSRAESEEGK